MFQLFFFHDDTLQAKSGVILYKIIEQFVNSVWQQISSYGYNSDL